LTHTPFGVRGGFPAERARQQQIQRFPVARNAELPKNGGKLIGNGSEGRRASGRDLHVALPFEHLQQNGALCGRESPRKPKLRLRHADDPAPLRRFSAERHDPPQHDALPPAASGSRRQSQDERHGAHFAR